MTAEVPASAAGGMRGSEVERKRDGARSTLVWDVLQEVITARAAQSGRTALDIVDVGGGTGGFAVPFAALGHRVTVVDPSPDALAAAQRRAAEMRVTLTAVQGEADGLDSLAGERAADLIICHNVLEYVDSPVLHRALAGRYAEARQLLATDGSGAGVPRRFTLAGLTALIEGAGLRPGDAHGIRVFAGLLPGGAAADPGTADALRALEEAAAVYPALRDIAARLHVLGRR